MMLGLVGATTHDTNTTHCQLLNPLECRGNYNAILNNMKLED